MLPIGFLAMLVVGVLAAAGDGRFGAGSLLAVTSLLVAVTAAIAEPLAAAPLAVIGWFTVAGFSRAPYGELHLRGTALPAVVLAIVAGAAAGLGSVMRRVRGLRSRYAVLALDPAVTLDAVRSEPSPAAGAVEAPEPRSAAASTAAAHHATGRPPGLSRGRLCAGLAMAAVLLPLLTLLLTATRSHLALVDDLLLYLLAVILVTLVGGFWPAVFAALAAGLLLNWYFTPPVHTWTIESPTNMFALLLFVTSAVTVSSVVHLAARRDAIAAERAAEAATLLTLARTVLGGDDSPQAILAHLTRTLGVTAELQERSGGARWIRVAGTTDDGQPRVIAAGTDLRLCVYGDLSAVSVSILDGFGAQAAAAFERQRLRIQAGQAEALAEGNRMRTALLAAVSHDLRSPLASVKAAVGSLRQTDVEWTEQDRSSLLATIEEGADRLDSLIGNLLDMSRIHTGALQPFVRPIALEEVAPLVARGIDGGERLQFSIPDTLPLIRTDPGLLERALANLVANALRYSPPDQPPTLAASASASASVSGDADAVTVQVIDHGPGIATAQRERVFEPFQQLGDRRTAGGVGLGLAVAKGFIESIGGRIAAQSTPGGGLTMRVELPVATRTHDAASSDR